MGQGQVGQADSVHAFLCLSISSIFFVVFLVLVLHLSMVQKVNDVELIGNV